MTNSFRANSCFCYGWREDDNYDSPSVVVNEGLVKHSFEEVKSVGFVSMGEWYLMVYGTFSDNKGYILHGSYNNGDIVLFDCDDDYQEFKVSSSKEVITLLDMVATGEIKKLSPDADNRA